MISSILKTYGIDYKYAFVTPVSGGLINQTWKVTYGNEHYILQQINHSVFKKPIQLAENIQWLNQYLQKNCPGYLFVAPLKNEFGEDIVRQQGYFRLLPFIKDSHTVHVVTSADQAFEAAQQFGRFTHLLSGFDAEQLTITIPNFHNLILRYWQFENAIKDGNQNRIKESKGLISSLRKHHYIVRDFEKISKNPLVKQRVTHHDTKISNVLFNDEGKGMCVIDLDTVMPGYFISDVGDMMRTYLSPANEEERDLNKIEVREDFFAAIAQGYLHDMGQDMTTDEQSLIFYSGIFMTYMQALRFLADYLNNDSYYGSRYEGHNLTRAMNQMVLLERLLEKQSIFKEVIAKEFKATFSNFGDPLIFQQNIPCTDSH